MQAFDGFARLLLDRRPTGYNVGSNLQASLRLEHLPG